MNIRFYNGRILAMDGDMEVRSGEVWIQGNRITYVGGTAGQDGRAVERGKDPRAWDREIDVEGNLIMPGFVNAHTHSAMTFLRSYADDLPLGSPARLPCVPSRR